MTDKVREAGFTTIELLVALAIFSIGLFALLEVKVEMLDRQKRQLNQVDKLVQEGNALVLLRKVNPATEPSGSRSLGDNQILSWNARRTGPFTRQLVWLGRETEYTVATYRIDYRITKNSAVNTRGYVEMIGRRAPD